MAATTSPMDWLQFVASVIHSLAWPAVILTVVLLIRRPLLKLIPKLKSFKYGDLEATFENGLDTVEADLLTLQPAESATRGTLPERIDTTTLFKLQLPGGTIRSPNEIIIHAWREIAGELRKLAESKSLGAAQIAPPFQLARILANKEYISATLFHLINELRKLRNVAAHSDSAGQITREQAKRYAENSAEVVEQLRLLHG